MHGANVTTLTAELASVTARLNATEALCIRCKAAEDALILALRTCQASHTAAQTAAQEQNTAQAAYTTAMTAYTTKATAFTTKKATLGYSALAPTDANSSFTTVVTVVGELQTLAAEYVTLGVAMNAANTVLFTKRTAYGIKAGLAVTADTAATTASGFWDSCG